MSRIAGLSAAPWSLALVVARPCCWMSLLFPALCPFLGLGAVTVVGFLPVHASCLFVLLFLFSLSISLSWSSSFRVLSISFRNSPSRFPPCCISRSFFCCSASLSWRGFPCSPFCFSCSCACFFSASASSPSPFLSKSLPAPLLAPLSSYSILFPFSSSSLEHGVGFISMSPWFRLACPVLIASLSLLI